jgi:nucleoid-associated protein YgaU
VLGIVEANQLANPRVIYPGQTLCIPNVGSGFQALPAGM